MDETAQTSMSTQQTTPMDNIPVNGTPLNQDSPKSLDAIAQVGIFFGNLCTFSFLGLILYLIWKDTRPEDAKNVCKLSLIAVGMDLLLIICYFVFILLIFGATAALISTTPNSSIVTTVPTFQ